MRPEEFAGPHVEHRPSQDGHGHPLPSTVSTRRAGGWSVRAFDLVIAAGALVFFAPLFLLVALAIRFADPGPVFFRHTRLGQGGAPFGCWKFRSMVVDAEDRLAKLLDADPLAAREWKDTQKLATDPRITSIGSFLRRSSLDELPQLMNVLTGDMSIVGPRPIVRDEVARYGDTFALYCQVRPGMTGLWQVSGRSDLGYDTRVRLDARYVRTRSLAGDLAIVMATIPKVLLGRGAA